MDGRILVSPTPNRFHQTIAFCPQVALYRLGGRHYVEHASARYGQRLMSAEPFPVNVDTTELFEA